MPDNEKRIVKKQIIEDLLLGGNARQRAVTALLDGLEAERSFYDAGSKATLCEPDYKTRVAAAELLLAYTDGRPIERKEIVQRNNDSTDELLARVKNSPALRDSLKQILMESEKPVAALPVSNS